MKPLTATTFALTLPTTTAVCIASSACKYLRAANGIKEAYRDITGKVTTEDIEAEQICNM